MGRPLGGENRDKPFKGALRRLIGSAGSNPEKLDAIAQTVVSMAMEGDLQAVQIIRDSLDGKPAQVIAGPDEGEGQPLIKEVVWTVVKPGEAKDGDS